MCVGWGPLQHQSMPDRLTGARLQHEEGDVLGRALCCQLPQATKHEAKVARARAQKGRHLQQAII